MQRFPYTVLGTVWLGGADLDGVMGDELRDDTVAANYRDS
jgi:hypothetical protein